MKKFDIRLLAMYIFGMGVISAITKFIFEGGHPSSDWFWRSVFMGVAGGTILYIWDRVRSGKKK